MHAGGSERHGNSQRRKMVLERCTPLERSLLDRQDTPLRCPDLTRFVELLMPAMVEFGFSLSCTSLICSDERAHAYDQF